ncbi:hypothetical protein NP233_g9834 [Leucocoprinus birnbaumii]|uniref:Ubiquitin-like protease family profile domain-containing protein n=1 Tax=Leucocoprinus birnbaumii TaxID=56174 RepID=A0AAD5YSH0_9AGAR|nr:hypothetical protein NP233_g9834 [Leucocoprinus birnbaumii]
MISASVIFSQEAPTTTDVYVIRAIALLSQQVASDLLSQARQEWLNGAESIRIQEHPGHAFPLWICSLWGTLSSVVVPAWQGWMDGTNWLGKNLPRAEVEATVQCLTSLSWGGYLSTTQSQNILGLPIRFPNSTLMEFLSQAWLSDEHIDLMLSLLGHKRHMPGSRMAVSTCILNSIHTQQIVQVYKGEVLKKTAEYDPTADGFLQWFGSSVTTTSLVGGIWHSQGNHWVAITIDVAKGWILYGDPAGGSVDSLLKDAFELYLWKHGVTSPSDTLILKMMKCTKQNTAIDTWSCGIYSYNALAHYIAGDTLFVGGSVEGGDSAQTQIFREIVHLHHAIISQSLDPALALDSSDAESSVLPTAEPQPSIPKLAKKLKPATSKCTKPKNQKSAKSAVLSKRKHEINFISSSGDEQDDDQGVVTELDDEDSDAITTPNGSFNGCPRLETLDKLTINITKPGETKWKYRSLHPPTASQMDLAVPNENSSVIQCTSGIKVSDPVPHSDNFFRLGGRCQIHNALNLLITQLFCDAQLPIRVADNHFWKAIFKIIAPSYKPASSTTLMESHISSEAQRVKILQAKELEAQFEVNTGEDDSPESREVENSSSLSSACDLMPMPDAHDPNVILNMLLEGQDRGGVSHTGEWIVTFVLQIMASVGEHRIGEVSSDNTGNTRVAQELICSALPHVLNLPDPIHHLNNTWKDIATLPYFMEVILVVRRTIKHFKYSGHTKGLLQKLRIKQKLGPGLESVGKTRFATLVWSAISVQRCLSAIQELHSIN